MGIKLNAFIHCLLPKKALTAFAGLMANNTWPWLKNYLIKNFIIDYNVNMSEAIEENPVNYPCFNLFFIRKLKPKYRPIAITDIVSPVDGVISETGLINQGQLIQAKGHFYSVHELLASNYETSKLFDLGYFTTYYLSPKDYHRVHMPIDAKLISMIHIPGELFSVKPSTVQCIPRLFARNERLVALFETSKGLMAMILVGATLVGAIGTAWNGDLSRSHKILEPDYPNNLYFKKGDEFGYFKLGSTVIVLFANANLDWSDKIKAGQEVKYGEALSI